MEGLARKFGIISAVIGFIVDLVAFLQLFGVRLIFAPAPASIALQKPIFTWKIPTDIETITFLIWLYSAIVLIVVAKKAEYRLDRVAFLPLLMTALPVMLLIVWLWGFGYVAGWLYVLLLPAVGFLAASWYTGTTYSSYYQKTFMIMTLIAFGLTILWFRTSFSWSFPVIVGAALVVCILANGIGYSLGQKYFVPFDWIKDSWTAFS